jgi:hypothetical protein
MKSEDELFDMTLMQLHWERFNISKKVSINKLIDKHYLNETLLNYLDLISEVMYLKLNHPQCLSQP